MMQLVVAEDPTMVFPPLDAFWSPDNRTTAGTGNFADDIDNGRLDGVSFYLGGSVSGLFLLGEAGVDTEEFDDHVIGHEWGHYFEDKFSRSDSIGGSHSLGDQLDMRLAFGEGFATALSGMGLGPTYCDTFGNTGFDIDIENENGGVDGWFNESSVMKILYDLWDNNDEGGFDPMSIGFGPIYDVMTGAQASTPAFTSIFSFATALKALPNPETAFIESQLAREDINGPGINIYGDAEMNDAGTPDDVLPVYTDITLGNTERICSNSQFDNNRSGNKLSEIRYFRLNLQSPTTLTFTVDTVNPDSTPSAGYDCTTAPSTDPEIREHSGPDFQLWRSGQLLMQAWSCEPNQEVATSGLLTPGDYVIDLAEFRYADPDSRINFPPQSCFDVTVTP